MTANMIPVATETSPNHSHNRPDNMLQIPNILTLSRIIAIPVVVGLLFMEPPLGNWAALGVYVLACVTDFFDGYLARVWQQQSRLGRFMDPIADKLLVGALLIMVVADDRLVGIHVLPAVVILCRELVVSGLREFLADLQVYVPVTTLSKYKTAIQMVAIGFLVVGPSGPDLAGVTALQVGVYGLWLAALLTLITGYTYLRAGLRHMAEPAP